MTTKLKGSVITTGPFIFFYFKYLNYIFAKLTAPLMKGGIDVTYKQVEASREVRLWLTQIVLPIVGVIMLVPDARQAVVAKVKQAKKNIETAFKKN